MMLACLLVAVLLLCGASLRSRFAIFDRIYIPPSVIAGFVGLIVFQPLARGDSILAPSLATAMESLRPWPTILIAVVFAGMLLPRATVPWRQSVRAAGREVLMVWIIVLGQTAIGLLVTWLIVRPMYDVPASFGMLIETGFAGGHGTANAMGQVFRSPQVNFPEGLDLGLLMATLGLVYGTVSGIFWINLAIRWGWVPGYERPGSVDQTATDDVQTDASSEAESTSVGVGSIASQQDARRGAFARGLDPLLVQAIWLALAVGIGWSLQSTIRYGTRVADKAPSRSAVVQDIEDGESAASPMQPVLS